MVRITAVVGIALIAVACSSPAGASPSPAATTASAPTAAADCVAIKVPHEGGWGTTADQAANAELIVVGEFRGYGSPRWNTPDGLRPRNARAARDLVSARIFRPIKVKINGTWKGDSQKVVKALEGGGALGCDSVTYVQSVELTVGERYVFFFWPVIDADGELRGNLMLSVAYPIAADGTVSRPDEPDVAVTTLAEQVRTGTVPTPTPELPGEPMPTDTGPG